jgi:hypothetical protein
MFSPQLRCFVATGRADGKGELAARRGALPDLKQWSSVEELRQLVQVGLGWWRLAGWRRCGWPSGGTWSVGWCVKRAGAAAGAAVLD